jgi:hypothetical protein
MRRKAQLVDLTRSPHRLAMIGICALPSSRVFFAVARNHPKRSPAQAPDSVLMGWMPPPDGIEVCQAGDVA